MSATAIDPGQRCLFVRSDSYGDLILFEPLLRAAVAALGAGNVGLVLRARYRDLEPLLPVGVRFFETDIDPYRSGPSDHAGALARLRGEIQAFDPDVVVMPAIEETWLDLYVVATQGRAQRIKHGEAGMQADLRQQLREVIGEAADFRIDAFVVPDGVTELERLRQLTRRLFGLTVGAEEAPRCRIPRGASQAVEPWLRVTGVDAAPYAVVFPAGVSNVTIKRWPSSRFARIARTLEQRHGLAIVVAGHDREAAIVDEVAGELHALGGNPHRWLGQDGGIAELAALLCRARLYVGNDTGPMHLAAAVGTPAVGIFGGGHWPRFVPGGTRSIAIAHPLPCNGCNWDCIWSHAHCIDLVDVSSVEQAVDAVLDGRGGFRVELAPKLGSEAMQFFADAAGKLRRERETASKRVSSYLAWAEEEKVLRERTEALLRDCEADRANAKRWAEEERVLRERTEALLRDCEADRADAKRSVEEERELRVRTEALFESDLVRLTAEVASERSRREAAEARLLVNRLRRVFGRAR